MPNSNEMDEQVDYVVELIDAIVEDTQVPRNIRKSLENAKDKILAEEGESLSVNATNAIYALDEVSNDINMPPHTRTEIWTIISELESIREKSKG